ncbi:hypothetical protein KU6B_54410 [Mameliella alba]|nr:hypothetical protein KU6B_54410 [Mameliella alba]
MNFRARVGAIVDAPRVQNAIIAVIILNAVVLGMETSEVLMGRYGALIIALDKFCLVVFVVEIAAKLLARGPGSFAAAGASSTS